MIVSCLSEIIRIAYVVGIYKVLAAMNIEESIHDSQANDELVGANRTITDTTHDYALPRSKIIGRPTIFLSVTMHTDQTTNFIITTNNGNNMTTVGDAHTENLVRICIILYCRSMHIATGNLYRI